MENTMATVSTEIITIPAYRENEFIEIITKLQKKQVKYNLPVGNYKEVKRYSKNIQHRTHIKGDCFRNDFINTVLMEFISFEVSGFSTIKKDDADEYIHIGTITKNWNTNITQSYLIEESYLDWFKNYPDTCNHCGTQRRRNEYYVFAKENEDTPYYIGSTCVKDYFGFNAPDMLKLRTKIFHLINNDYDDYNDDYKVISFNRIASYLDDRMTKSWDKIKAELKYEIDLFEDKSIISKDHFNLYDEVKNHYANPDSSFKQNASQVLKYDYCNRKNLMIYVCAVYYARKAIYLANKKANANQVMAKSNHNVGDKITLNNVKVTFIKTFTTSYDGYHTSYTTLIKMVTDNNEVYETYSSGAFADNIKVNDIVSITATVKGQGIFNGNSFWKLTRCKLI